jgi:hypothetical protein
MAPRQDLLVLPDDGSKQQEEEQRLQVGKTAAQGRRDQDEAVGQVSLRWTEIDRGYDADPRCECSRASRYAP